MVATETWDALAKPPKAALKQIAAGRLKGKTDINPQWRYRMMTEQFGQCGVGWRYTIDKLWTEPGADRVVFAFALVSLYVVLADGKWGEAIPGIGGHKLIESESKGLHNNDECFKMAVTDALGVAMKMLGMAAEIYMGNWDGSKYRDAPPDSGTPKGDGSGRFSKPPAEKPAEKPQSSLRWSEATSAERRDRTLLHIKEAAEWPNTDQALERLKKIAAGAMEEMAKIDADVVAATLIAAENGIIKRVEASGANQ